MKKLILILVLLSVCLYVKSQNAELNKLTDIVLSLRSGGESAYKSAIKSLSTDKSWTPMDELRINREVECKASDRTPGFKLNAILTNAENAERRQTTTGNHLNGADSRYNYSLFEKTLKAGKSVTYKLDGRWGEQVFVVIPYSGKIAVSISSDGKAFASSSLSNNAIKLTGNVVKDKDVEVKVRNEGTANVSYVIINYNSRK